MLCVGGARLALYDLLAVPVSRSLRPPRSSLRSLSSFWRFLSTPTCHTPLPPCRAFSNNAHSPDHSDLFNYTSGRWIYNDALRVSERRRVFNVLALCRLASASVNRTASDILSFTKLAEGGFNRTFLITMKDGFQMIARIPYPAPTLQCPKYYALASEVATMSFLRSSGLPVPEVYGYDPTMDNEAETEYIFMEFVRGTKLSDVWNDLEDREIVSVLRQLVKLEAKMMSVTFPAGGSLYSAQDLEQVPGERVKGIPLEDDERFCIGPDVRMKMWFGRRSRLDVDRGPYETAEAALTCPAYKELAYLERFGQPLLPFQRVRREAYKYKEQTPLEHVENLNRYLLIAPSLVPKDQALCHFRIRHPDLQESNIIVSKSNSPNTDCDTIDFQIVGLLDWQHASILPTFLSAGIPETFQNYNDPISRAMTLPSLPANVDELGEIKQSRAKYIYHRRFAHYHYVKSTEEFNEIHYEALTGDPEGWLRRRLFYGASDQWEGDSLALKVALIEAEEKWERLQGQWTGLPSPPPSPCPFSFDAEDVRETMKLDAEQDDADDTMEMIRMSIGCGPDGWVDAKRYEEAVKRVKRMKEVVLESAPSEKERAEIVEHWPLDDMDEVRYA